MLAPDYPVLTDRLALRPLHPAGDLEAVLAYQSRADVCRYVPYEPRSRAEVAERLRTARSTLTEEGQSLLLAIVLRSTEALIGDATLFWHSAKHRGGEIGYVLNPAYQGHGYATEASRAMLALGFDGLGLHRVIARLDSRNAASANVLRRLGMRQEAHLVQNEWFKGEWTDELDFAMLATEWAQRVNEAR